MCCSLGLWLFEPDYSNCETVVVGAGRVQAASSCAVSSSLFSRYYLTLHFVINQKSWDVRTRSFVPLYPISRSLHLTPWNTYTSSISCCTIAGRDRSGSHRGQILPTQAFIARCPSSNRDARQLGRQGVSFILYRSLRLALFLVTGKS